VSSESAKSQRSDARRNHALLVAAARAVFAEQGVDASVEEIVERAGLGTGTLYRHFPDREALVDAIFEERTGEVVEVIERALGCADPFLGVQQLLEQMVALQRGDRVLKELLMRYPPKKGLFGEMRDRIEQLSEQLLARARGQGVLRADFTFADLMVLVWSLHPILDATSDIAPEAWRRHLNFVIDGLRPGAATKSPVPPLTADELAAAMQCLRTQRFQRWNRAEHGHVQRTSPTESAGAPR
jgi:AcrR family transcriptional regulator